MRQAVAFCWPPKWWGLGKKTTGRNSNKINSYKIVKLFRRRGGMLMLSNASTFHATLEQLRKGHAPCRQASGVCSSKQPLSTCAVSARINSHDLVCSKGLIPKAPSDLKGTAVPSLVHPWKWDIVPERRPSKVTATLEQKGGKQPYGKLEKLCRSERWEAHLPFCANQEEQYHGGSALLSSGESAQFQWLVLIPALGSFLRVTRCSSRFSGVV